LRHRAPTTPDRAGAFLGAHPNATDRADSDDQKRDVPQHSCRGFGAHRPEGRFPTRCLKTCEAPRSFLSYGAQHTASFILELPLKTDPGDERACAIILDAGRNIGNAVLGEGSAPIPLATPISESRSSVSGLNLHSPRPILASRPRNQNRRSRQGGSRRLGTLEALMRPPRSRRSPRNSPAATVKTPAGRRAAQEVEAVTLCSPQRQALAATSVQCAQDQSIPFSTPVSRVTINYKSVGRYETR
jgi:hypothetical protein